MEKTGTTGKTNDIIKALWIKHGCDSKEILKEIADGTDINTYKEKEREVQEFNKKYGSIVAVDDAYDIIAERIEQITTTNSEPFLIRWNLEATHFANRIITGYENSVFILDDIDKYKIPEGIYAVGFRNLNRPTIADVVQPIKLADETGQTVLETFLGDEVLWFALRTCRYLLIGSKELGEISLDEQDFYDNLIELFKKKGGQVLAIPGKPGCYSNQKLKNAEADFIDGWQDVLDRFDKIPDDTAI